MFDQPNDAGENSINPPIYTYWGQFVDHDLTANTDRDDDIGITDIPLQPLQPERVLHDLRNLREPQLNLDSVYGHGPGPHSHDPGQVPFTGDKFDIGTLAAITSTKLPGADLPRINKVPQIGDGRNDENLIIAQLHLGFLKFHNAVVDWLAAHVGTRSQGMVTSPGRSSWCNGTTSGSPSTTSSRPSRCPRLSTVCSTARPNGSSTRMLGKPSCHWSSRSRPTGSGTAWSAPRTTGTPTSAPRAPARPECHFQFALPLHRKGWIRR